MNYRRAETTMPLSGLPYSLMSGDQRQHLVRLIRHYVSRVAQDVAANEWRRIESAGFDPVTFAWAGPEEQGLEHYYSVVGPKFIIEYDNTQTKAITSTPSSATPSTTGAKTSSQPTTPTRTITRGIEYLTNPPGTS